MATKTIGQLSTASSVANADLIEIEQGGVSKSISLSYVMPVGAMTPFAGAAAPSGWLFCDGSAVNRSTYSALFTIISTTWGAGDGATTFNIPDMREKVPVGIGTSGTLITSTGSAVSANDVYTLAQFKDHQTQGHNHSIRVWSATDGTAYARGSGGSGSSGDPNVSAGTVSDGVNGTPKVGTTTRGKRVGVNYIIKY